MKCIQRITSLFQSTGNKSDEGTIAIIEKRLSECLEGRIEAGLEPSELSSRIGGIPWLPSDLPHPCDRSGKPMLFVAQINFAELPKCSLNKAEVGLFMLFWNALRDFSTPKDKRAFSCVWIPQPETKTFCPSDIEGTTVCPPLALKFSTGWSLPEHEAAWNDSGLEEKVWSKVAEGLRGERSLQIFGQAGKRFDSLQEIAAFAGNGITWNEARRSDPCFSHLVSVAPEWELLMQMTFPPEANPGSGARSMHLLIRREDLAQYDYARAWLLIA